MNESETKPKYAPPQAFPLGEVVRGSGCSCYPGNSDVGSQMDEQCSHGLTNTGPGACTTGGLNDA